MDGWSDEGEEWSWRRWCGEATHVGPREEEEAVAMKRLSSVWRGSMIRGATTLLVGNEDAADFRDSKERWRWRRGSGGCRQLWCRVEMRQCVWQWRRERLVVEVSRWGEDIGIGADYGLWRRIREEVRGSGREWKRERIRRRRRKRTRSWLWRV